MFKFVNRNLSIVNVKFVSRCREGHEHKNVWTKHKNDDFVIVP